MRISRNQRVGIAAALTMALQVAAVVAAPHTISVDCTRGRSVQRAVENRAAELIVEISGLCQEDVVIERSDITLRGVNPGAVDGLQGSSADVGGDHAVLLVRGGSRVRIENLRIVQGSRFGLNVRDGAADVIIVASKFLNNARAGISLSGSGGVVDATDVEISGSLRGFQVFEAGIGLCHHCNVSSTGTAFLVVSARGFVDGNSTLTGSFAALSGAGNATLGATDSTLTGAEYSVFADSNSIVQLSGSLALGSMNLQGFANATLNATSTISGNLTCSSGGDAHCVDPNDVTGTTSSCERCVKP